LGIPLPVATALSSIIIKEIGVPCVVASIIKTSLSTKLFIQGVPIFLSPGSVIITGLVESTGFIQLPTYILTANINSSTIKTVENFIPVIREGDSGIFIMPPGSMVNVSSGTPVLNPIPFTFTIEVSLLSLLSGKVYST
jgi:hypothetical protein